MRAGNAGSSLNYIPAPSRGWGGQSWPRDYVNCLSCYGRIWIRPFLCRSCCVHPPTPFLIAAFVGFNCWQAVRSEHAGADPSGFAAKAEPGSWRGPGGLPVALGGFQVVSGSSFSPTLCCSPALPIVPRGRQSCWAQGSRRERINPGSSRGLSLCLPLALACPG